MMLSGAEALSLISQGNGPRLDLTLLYPFDSNRQRDLYNSNQLLDSYMDLPAAGHGGVCEIADLPASVYITPPLTMTTTYILHEASESVLYAYFA